MNHTNQLNPNLLNCIHAGDFTFDLYDSDNSQLDTRFPRSIPHILGVCSASQLNWRTGGNDEVAIMFENSDFEKFWFHATWDTYDYILEFFGFTQDQRQALAKKLNIFTWGIYE